MFSEPTPTVAFMRARFFGGATMADSGAASSCRRDPAPPASSGPNENEPSRPSASDLQLIEEAARVELIAIQSDRSQTALQRAYQEIKQSEGRLRKIIDTIPTLAWCSSPDGTGEFWNRRWHDYTGLSHEAVRGWGWQDAIHPEDLQEINDKWLGFLASGQPGEVEGRLRRFDGTYRWFLFRAEPLRDESGNILNWYGTDTDIEDLKQHAYELRRITDAIPQAIVVQQPDGTPIYANQVTLEYTGLTLEDVQAEGYLEKTIHPDDLERVREVLPKAFASGEPFEIEQRTLGKNGKYRWFLIRYNPLLDETGTVIRWYATGTDIDERDRKSTRLNSSHT